VVEASDILVEAVLVGALSAVVISAVFTLVVLASAASTEAASVRRRISQVAVRVLAATRASGD
jgi:hypothetical protein